MENGTHRIVNGVLAQVRHDGAVALNWTVNVHGETIFAIPGASKLRHAEENVRAMGFRLTAEELGELDELSSSVARK